MCLPLRRPSAEQLRRVALGHLTPVDPDLKPVPSGFSPGDRGGSAWWVAGLSGAFRDCSGFCAGG